MPKIFVYIGAIITAAFIFFIGFLLYPDGNNEFHFQENIQNINHQEEIEKKKAQEIKKRKKTNDKMIIFLIIGSMILAAIIIIICFVFLSSQDKWSIASAEQMVKNFIKIKKMALFSSGGLQFVAYVFGVSENILSKFEKITKFTEGGQKRAFLLMSDVEDMKIINSVGKSPRDMLLDLLVPGFNKEQIKKKFQGHEELLDLILIVQLNLFGNLGVIDKNFILLNNGKIDVGIKIDEIKRKIENQFFCFNKVDARDNNDRFFESVRLLSKCDDVDFSAFENDFYKNLDSLIGDRENGYQVNKSSFDYLKTFESLYLLTTIKENGRTFYKDCTTIFYLFEEIKLILQHFGFFKELNKKERLPWRIMVKTLIEALQFFHKICNEN